MNNQLLFLLLVFGTVVLLFQSLFVSVYNPQRASAKNIRKHLNSLANENNDIATEILLNKKIETLPPFLQWLESRPWINNLSYKMELSGSNLLGYQYLFITLASCCIAGVSMWFITLDIVVSLFSIIFTLFIMHIIINRNINKRMENIEREFPEALDVLKRGLQAGYAFSDSLKLVFEETDGDLSNEFRMMFNRINYGNDIHTALLSFVKRVPTTSAMAFSSAVSIQKETGGNLAENVENLSKIIRQRFTFQRRVKTLSAEGRLSGWILSLTPFILFAGLYFISPDYANVLMGSPEGLNLLKWGGIGMFIGIWWISRLIKIEV